MPETDTTDLLNPEGKGGSAFAALLASQPPTDQGGSTAVPNPADTAALAANFGKAASIPAPDKGDLSAGTVGMPQPTPGMPSASPVPSGLDALGHPSFDPMHHMSFATALNLAYNPMAMQMLSHVQQMQHQQNVERLQNMTFQQQLDQHARDAAEHADTVKNAAQQFRQAIVAAHGRFLKPGEQAGADEGVFSHFENGQEVKYAMPSAEKQAQYAKDAKAKDTVTVPHVKMPDGSFQDIDGVSPDKALEWSAKQSAAEAKGDEKVEKQVITRPDGHSYAVGTGERTGKKYYETDLGPVMAGEKEQEAKTRQQELQETRKQAALDRHQQAEDRFKEHIGKQLDIHGTNIGNALKANATEADAFREQENARQEWQQAQQELTKPDVGDAEKKTLTANANAAYKQMKNAEAKANSATENKIRTWQIARQHHGTLSAGPYAKYLDTGEENGIPYARFKPTAAPGAEAVTGGDTAAATAPQQAQATGAGAGGNQQDIEEKAIQQVMQSGKDLSGKPLSSDQIQRARQAFRAKWGRDPQMSQPSPSPVITQGNSMSTAQ